MPIIEIPKFIRSAMKTFIGQTLSNRPQREHMAQYITGLIMSENKTITGITDDFPDAPDQSCKNRFLTSADWDVNALNEARIQWLQTSEDTAFHPKGIIALDDVLIDNAGKQIKDVGYFWDHAEQRHKLAQDILIINYVNPTSGKHYPLEFRRFKKEDQCELTGEDFKKLTTLAIELIDWCHDHKVPGTFTFDSFYTCKEILNHINSLTVSGKTGEEARGYVGDLKFNRKIEFNGVVQQAQEFAKTLPGNCRKPITLDGQKQWYFTRSIHIPEVDHKVRIVILWEHKNDAEPKKILVTNKTYWRAERVAQSYKYRWTGTETFHRDGKQELGLGDCQLRSDMGQTRYTYLVFLAYSFLIHELDKTSASEWACVKLTTIGEACRALIRDSLKSVIKWVAEEIESSLRSGRRDITKPLAGIMQRLRLA